MVFQALEYWEVAIDGIQILLCILILLFLIRNRFRRKKLIFKEVKNEHGQSFNAQVFTQTIKQQLDQAFENILETFATERRNLERVLQLFSLSLHNLSNAEFQTPLWLSNSHETPLLSDDIVKADARLEDVEKLAIKGASAKQISERLKIPMGEVELILNLKKAGT